jgi:hypothetical protein
MSEWWTWVERASLIISAAATRVSLAILTAGTSIAAASLFNTDAGAAFARPMLGASAVFGVWFAASAGLAQLRAR